MTEDDGAFNYEYDHGPTGWTPTVYDPRDYTTDSPTTVYDTTDFHKPQYSANAPIIKFAADTTTDGDLKRKKGATSLSADASYLECRWNLILFVIHALAAIFSLSAGAIMIHVGNLLTSVLMAGHEVKSDRAVWPSSKEMKGYARIDEKLNPLLYYGWPLATAQRYGGYITTCAGLSTLVGLYASLPLVLQRNTLDSLNLPLQMRFKEQFLEDFNAAYLRGKSDDASKKVETEPIVSSPVIEFANFDRGAYDLSAFQRTFYENADYDNTVTYTTTDQTDYPNYDYGTTYTE